MINMIPLEVVNQTSAITDYLKELIRGRKHHNN